MPTASSLRRPRTSRPVASSRTASPTWRQLSVCQVPLALYRWAARSPSRSTRFQNMLARLSWAMVPSSHLCAELFAENLADRALGQRIDEADLLRALEAGQPGLAERGNLLGGGARTGLLHHERHHVLAHQRVLHADHRGLGHLRMRVQHLLDLAGVDVEPATDDQVLLALDDEEEAV